MCLGSHSWWYSQEEYTQDLPDPRRAMHVTTNFGAGMFNSGSRLSVDGSGHSLKSDVSSDILVVFKYSVEVNNKDMSKRIASLYEGHNTTRHVPHVTPTTEVYQTSKIVSHDRKVHHVPASQLTSYNVFPRTHEIQPEISISNAWQGSTAEVEFEIPRNLYLLNKVSLQFTCRIMAQRQRPMNVDFALVI